MEGRVAGRNDHGALGHSVVGSDLEVLRREVGNKNNGWPVTEKLLDDGVGVGEGLQHREIERFVPITASGVQILLTQTIEDIGTLGKDLEQPCCGAARRILRREEEGEQSLPNLVVGELANQIRWLLHVRFSGRNPLAVSIGLHHVKHPVVHNAGRRRTSCHICLAGRRAFLKLGMDSIASTFPQPLFGPRDIHRQRDIDELHGGGSKVEVVGDFLDRSLGNVVAEEGAARNRTVDLAEHGHERSRSSLIFCADIHKLVEVVREDSVVNAEVSAQGLVREQWRQSSPILGVLSPLEKNPCPMANEVLGNRYDAWFGICGRLEDLVGKVAFGDEDDESAKTQRYESEFS